MTNVLAWLVVDKNGGEWVYPVLPVRTDRGWDEYTSVELPRGSIEKLIGKKLTWRDKPYMIKG